MIKWGCQVLIGYVEHWYAHLSETWRFCLITEMALHYVWCAKLRWRNNDVSLLLIWFLRHSSTVFIFSLFCWQGSLLHIHIKLPVTWAWIPLQKMFSVVLSSKRKCCAPQGTQKVLQYSVWSSIATLKVCNVLLARLTAISSDTLTLTPLRVH